MVHLLGLVARTLKPQLAEPYVLWRSERSQQLLASTRHPQELVILGSAACQAAGSLIWSKGSHQYSKKLEKSLRGDLDFRRLTGPCHTVQTPTLTVCP